MTQVERMDYDLPLLGYGVITFLPFVFIQYRLPFQHPHLSVILFNIAILIHDISIHCFNFPRFEVDYNGISGLDN